MDRSECKKVIGQKSEGQQAANAKIRVCKVLSDGTFYEQEQR